MRSMIRSWLPLAVSFELMLLEGPIVQSAIGRLPDPSLNLASWGLTLSLSLLVESPVIMLLATSIALTSGRQSFREMRKFTINLLVGCTILTSAVAFTPLFGVISSRLMGQPNAIVVASQPAMQIMLLWTAAIAWRRFLQGVLVRYGQSKMVTWGTGIRLVVTAITAVALLQSRSVNGVSLGAITLMAAVIAEAIATTVFVGPTLRDKVYLAEHQNEKLITQKSIAAFHTPLAMTTLLTLLANPMTAAALARLDHPKETLAAWPVASMLLLVMRGWGLALQEITVSVSRNQGDTYALKRFALWVGGITSALTLAIASTGFLDIYLDYIVHAPHDLKDHIRTGLYIGFGLPLVSALGSYVRGMLMSHGQTKLIYHGMAVNLGTNIVFLLASIWLRSPGIVAGAVSFMAAATIELLYLTAKQKKGAH